MASVASRGVRPRNTIQPVAGPGFSVAIRLRAELAAVLDQFLMVHRAFRVSRES